MRELDPGARRQMERYLGEIRTSLQGTPLDAEEIAADVRDHLRESLDRAGGTHSVSTDEMKDALDALGPPDRWLPPDTGGMYQSVLGWTHGREGPVAALVLVLTVAGAGSFPWIGPIGLLPAWLVARAVSGAYRRAGVSLGSWQWLVNPPLWIVAVGLAVLLAVGPFPVLAELTGEVFGDRPNWIGGVLGIGLWWIVLGFLVRGVPHAFRWLLHPLGDGLLARHGFPLAGTGVALSVAAGAALWLTG